MGSEGLAQMDTRFPPTPLGVRWFMILYPVAMVLASGWFSGRHWFLAIAAFCALAWFGATCVFFANKLHREGYQAAMDDLSKGQKSSG